MNNTIFIIQLNYKSGTTVYMATKKFTVKHTGLKLDSVEWGVVDILQLTKIRKKFWQIDIVDKPILINIDELESVFQYGSCIL